MVKYTEKELQSATNIARNFGKLLESLKSGSLDKIAVLRNNKLDAVIIPVEEYNRLCEKESLAEHAEIFKIINDRMGNSNAGLVSWEKVLEKNGINENEL